MTYPKSSKQVLDFVGVTGLELLKIDGGWKFAYGRSLYDVGVKRLGDLCLVDWLIHANRFAAQRATQEQEQKLAPGTHKAQVTQAGTDQFGRLNVTFSILDNGPPMTINHRMHMAKLVTKPTNPDGQRVTKTTLLAVKLRGGQRLSGDQHMDPLLRQWFLEVAQIYSANGYQSRRTNAGKQVFVTERRVRPCVVKRLAKLAKLIALHLKHSPCTVSDLTRYTRTTKPSIRKRLKKLRKLEKYGGAK